MSGVVVRVSRRQLLSALGLAAGGLALGMIEGDANAQTARPPAPPVPASEKYPRNADTANDGHGGFSPNAFVHVAPDGHITIVCHRSEMGQGIRSSLPALICDEIGGDMSKMTIVQGDGDKIYGDQNTDGSRSVRSIFDEMRKVGATARVMLVAAAAKKWNVPAAECTARMSEVTHDKTKKKLGFGALVTDAAKLPVPKLADVPMKPKSEWTYAGKALPLVDGPAIATGTAKFAADVKLPGMLYAVIARPPVVGSRATHVDSSKALAIKGVTRVFELPAPTPPYKFQPLGGVAVIADGTWAAMRGRAALDVQWAKVESSDYDTTAFRETLLGEVRKPGRVVRKTGDVDKALSSAAKTIDAEYTTPHLAHASMEPPCALASVTADGCEVWACTQDPQTAQKEIAAQLGIPIEKVKIHITFLGGGFGRKSKADFVVEAAMLSREMKAPVRVQWTREDDIRHDYYHSICAQKLTAAIDAQGKVTAWRHRTAFPPIGSTFTAGAKQGGDGELNQGVTDVPVAIANVQAENGEAPAKIRIGWLRSVHNIHHAFAVGSFVDEIAHAKNIDPKDAWLELLGPARNVSQEDLGVAKLPNYGASLADHPIDVGRLRHVIERVTELSDFSRRRKGNASAMGLSAHRSFLTYVACVVQVTRDSSGKIRVEAAWVVVDAGTVVNPDRVRSQMEGAVQFGSSIALKSAITVKNGAVVESNFRDYKLVRMADAPNAIHVEIVPSDAKPGGVGEPGVPPIAPAIANAVFALTGTRVRDLPIQSG